MRTRDIIRRSGKNLRQAKTRTILTSLAIGVGAFTIALAMAAGNGGRSYLDEQVSSAGDMQTIQVYAQQESTTVADNAPRKVDEAPVMQGSFRELTPQDRRTIEQLSDVERVSPIFSVSPISAQANGSDRYEAQVQVQMDGTAIELTAGELGDDYQITSGQIVLPHIYLESFGFSDAGQAIGKNVTIEFAGASQTDEPFKKEFTIAAVDAEPTSALSFYNNEFRISNQDGEEIAALQRPDDVAESYFALMVTAREGADVDQVKQQIIEAGDFDASTFAEMRTSIMQMVNIVQYGLMGFGALAILASIFGIINTQYISVLERTQQIGLMKALGAQRKDIARMFRYEAAWIGFLGGLIGVVLAFLVTLFNPVLATVIGLEEGRQLLQMDWLLSGALIAGLMIVAILSGGLPARKAAKLDPIDALRSE